MITFVSAFLCGEMAKHSRDDYRARFLQLADTGVHIVLFLDRKAEWVSFPPNVRVIQTQLEDTWVGKNIPVDAILPPSRSPPDTREYMMIINSKPEFVLRASEINPWNTDWFAWIDFGIGHVFRDPVRTYERIRTLVPPTTPCIRTAGIWSHIPEDLFHGVCWRFAGGFFLIHKTQIEKFHEAAQASILRSLPKFAWEVNIWADVERNGMDLGWFRADHNDTVIPFTLS